MSSKPIRATFPGSQGHDLAARLDLPIGKPRAFALFAHCFTCSKDVLAAKRIAAELSRLDIAVLRFDFTGLGSSKGEFANTNFSSNVEDLIAAADYLRQNYSAPQILIGHSLGGAAVLAGAGDIPEAQAVITIGAPADAEHVIHNFGAAIEDIEASGEAKVSLGGREFTIKKQFLDDVRSAKLDARIESLRKSLLVMHSPIDQTVGIENAAHIFTTAKHPKSFISLDNADHLLTKPKDAVFAAQMISAFVSPFLDTDEDVDDDHTGIDVIETGNGKFQNLVHAGQHTYFADEPKSFGGLDSGPSPYDFLSIALGACTSMTIRMYADFKKLNLGKISVHVEHQKIHAKDCEVCAVDQQSRSGKIDHFTRVISIEGEFDPELKPKLLQIADKCPVHKTIESTAIVETEITQTANITNI